ncbi:MAG: hypothetical protein JSS75_02120 [Bacteroidetes bacterium]|nr:hypothetical protein [Bacteroidota bacterium]
MKRIWKILIVVVVLGAIGAGYGYYQFSRPNKDLATARPDVTVTASDLVNAYSADETAATAKYAARDKVILVRGVLKSIERDSAGTASLVLDGGMPTSVVSCQLAQAHIGDAQWVHAGDSVSVIGSCSGFENLIDVRVVMTRCAVERPHAE